ncbi:2'-5' RNA ligase [Algoriphagus ratkowskyi]|nr:2'-5' RNA ligase family protein [Algoriphagus ratkowskyi]PZX59871.1 2'-5' RNA ligase [Algoriphagus ratkowskyi]
MKMMQKYFLAVVPEGKVMERITKLKVEIKDRHQAKFALKSPAHITVKMPFIYNEAKENKLILKLGEFIEDYRPMLMRIRGVKTFGQRVIYLGVDDTPDLFDFQRELKSFCKRELNLVDELSDRNFHPHMTIAFKDIKKEQFQNILKLATETNLDEVLSVTTIALLKKVEGRWEVLENLKLGQR